MGNNTFQVLDTAPWGTDDKIITRDGFLKFATFDGDKFVGGLVYNNQLSMSLGYKIYYSGALNGVLEQPGLPQSPVEPVTLRAGWNLIGHAPLHTFPIAEIGTPPPFPARRRLTGKDGFSADDQFKTRAGSSVWITTFSGDSWQGGLTELTPGIGYEVKVAQDITFCYGECLI